MPLAMPRRSPLSGCSASIDLLPYLLKLSPHKWGWKPPVRNTSSQIDSTAMTNLSSSPTPLSRTMSRIAVGVLATAALAAGSLTAAPALADPSPRITTVLPGAGLHPVGVAFSPDGDSAYVADQGGFLSTYNVADNSFVSEIGVAGAPPASNCSLSDVAVTSTGANLYTPGWNCTGGSKLLKYVTGSSAQPQQIALKVSDISASVTGAAAVTPDNSEVLVFAETSQNRSGLFIYDTTTSVVRIVDLGGASASGDSPSDIVISADSSSAWVTTRTGTVARVALDSDAVTLIPVDGNAHGLAIVESIGAVFAVTDTGMLDSISMSSNSVYSSEEVSDSSLDGIAISSDGVKIVVIGHGGSASSGRAWVFDDSSSEGTVTYALGSAPWDVAIDASNTKAYSPNWGSGKTDIIPLVDSAPIFTADSAATSATVGKSYSAQFTASGSPIPTYSATGTLPTGLTLNTATGLLSGKPTAGGTFSFQVVASNGVLPVATGVTHTVTILKVLKTSTPTISGTKKVGKKLTAKKSSWSPSPVSYKYQWYRSSKGSYVKISKATKSTYTLTKSDKGRKVRVVLTGSKSGYVTVSKTSKSYAIK